MIKECPFCGETNIKIGSFTDFIHYGYVDCKNCQISVRCIADTEEIARKKAIDKWNTRPSQIKTKPAVVDIRITEFCTDCVIHYEGHWYFKDGETEYANCLVATYYNKYDVIEQLKQNAVESLRQSGFVNLTFNVTTTKDYDAI